MSDRQALVKKVRALLARAADAASSENEALKAASMAAKLMDEHAIGESELERGTTGFKLAGFAFKFNWQGDIYFNIAQDVADFYGCFVWANKSVGKHSVNFHGEESDVICAQWLVETLGRFVIAGWQHRLSELSFPTPHERERYRYGYLLGAAQRINARLRAMLAARTASYAGTTLPALVDKATAARNALVAGGARFDSQAAKSKMVPTDSLTHGQARGDAAPIRSGIDGTVATAALPSR